MVVFQGYPEVSMDDITVSGITVLDDFLYPVLSQNYQMLSSGEVSDSHEQSDETIQRRDCLRKISNTHVIKSRRQ